MCLGTLKGPDHTYAFSFENEYFSVEFSSIVHTKTTENDHDGNGSFRKWFQKQSLLKIYLFNVLKTPRFLSRKVTTEAFENGAEKKVIYCSFLHHYRAFP